MRKTKYSLLTQHALISWQRRSIAMWQLNATRPSSQSSRKSATTSLDQSCPMTSMARHSLLCPYSASSPKVTLAEHGLLHRAFWTPIDYRLIPFRSLLAPLLSDSHLVFGLQLPYSSLCNDGTALPTHVLQFLEQLLGRKRTNLHPPNAVPIFF